MNIEQDHFEKQDKPNLNTYFIMIGILAVSFVAGYYFNEFAVGKKFISSRPGTVGSQGNGTTTVEIIADRNDIPSTVSKKVDFNLFWQAWDYIQSNYVDTDVTDPQLFYGSMEGMVASLGDPYSVYFEPELSKKFQQEISGSFDGIGAEIGLKNNIVTIISPLSGGPAQKAGLKAGDSVISIDGKETKDISLDYAVELIRGIKGTSVTLIIFRKGEADTRSFSVQRDKIGIESVEWSLLPGNIIDLKLKYFNEDTLDDFRDSVNEFMAKKPKGIILDMRNNPGGLLSTAIEITSFWVGGDENIVIERGRDGQYVGERANNNNAILKNIPTIVLINKGSASGSEILAGALQDLKLAELVGETSFGKGSVQDLRELRDGSSIKLTIAKWFTPLGREINEKGIDPDITIELTDEDWNNDKDPQMDKAIELLTKK